MREAKYCQEAQFTQTDLSDYDLYLQRVELALEVHRIEW